MKRIYDSLDKANFTPRVGGGLALLIPGVILLGSQIVYAVIVKEINIVNIVLGFISLIPIFLGARSIYFYVNGSYKKYIKESLEQENISEYSLQCDLRTAKRIANGKVEIGEEYIIMYGDKPDVGRYHDIIWAFHTTATVDKKIAGIIPVGQKNIHKVMLVNEAHMCGEIEVDTIEEANEIIKELQKRLPHILVGLDEELVQMEKNDFNEMIRLVEERKKSSVTE